MFLAAEESSWHLLWADPAQVSVVTSLLQGRHSVISLGDFIRLPLIELQEIRKLTIAHFEQRLNTDI